MAVVGASKGLAGMSRATHSSLVLSADTMANADRYRHELATRLQEVGAAVLIPISDTASRRLLGHDAMLGLRVAGPTADAYERASDKAHLLEVAAQCGIATPRQWVLEGVNQLDDLLQAVTSQRLPVVVKPSRSVVEGIGGAIKAGVVFVDEPRHLRRTLEGYDPQSFPLLVQERIVGDGVGVFLLRHHGETILQFGHRRLREKPPAGGVSTYRESMIPPPELTQRCEQLLAALDYDGPAMVEFKLDQHSGRFVLMEINARLWGSLQLAIDAGVDFPSTMVAVSLGRSVPPSTAPRAGLRSVWEIGELDHALAIGRRSRDELHVPSSMSVGAAAAWRALVDHRWSDVPEVFRWSDPKPFAAELVRWLRRQ